jgi:hypothetical protein
LDEQRRQCQVGIRGGEEDLLNLLWKFRSWLSTDPRDKLFALLPLLPLTTGVAPNYKDSADIVFGGLAKHLILARKDLDVLCHCQEHPEIFVRNYRLPSWAPDWSKPTSSSSFILGPLGLFSPGGWINRIRFKRKNKYASELVLEGIELGEIGECFSIDTSDRLTIINSIQSLASHILSKGSGKYGEKDKTLEAFWRTLIVDRHYSKRRRLTSEDRSVIERRFMELYKYDGTSFRFMASTDFLVSLQETTATMRFCITQTGHFAMVPKHAKEGDRICLLYGGKILFVLRPREPGNGLEEGTRRSAFKFIGPAYMHQFMDNEAADMSRRFLVERRKRVFTIE